MISAELTAPAYHAACEALASPTPANERAPVPAPALAFKALGSRVLQGLQILNLRGLVQPRARRLQVRETVSLGEKRFLSIVEVDGVGYLIGGGSANVSLLTQLSSPAPTTAFQTLVQDAWTKEGAR